MANSSSKRYSGSIKWFNSEKGFGFVVPSDGGKDVFIHVNDVRDSRINPDQLIDGAKISYSLKEARGKTSAADIVIE